MSSPKASRTTIRDVAQAAGVSAMTVSRVLSGAGVQSPGQRVAPETARRVLEAAREMDYIAVRPTLQNKRLATRVVGVVFDGVDSVKSFVGAHAFEGLRDEAMRRGFDLLLHAQKKGATDALQREEAAFLDRRTDGVIFISPRERRALLEGLVRHGFPVVSCFSTDVPEGVATVTPDNAGAMKRAVKYLRGLGHERIAFFGGPAWHSDARERHAAWSEAMRREGLERCLEWAESSSGETARHIAAARRILSLRPTAVVCHNDFRALLLEEAARARGVEVPRDLSLLGMDDVPEAAARGLSTLRVSFEDAGRAAVHAVLEMIDGAPASQASRLIEAPLVERRSAAPLP